MEQKDHVVLGYYGVGGRDALVFREGAVQPFVYASGYDRETGEWSQGSYFSDPADAVARAQRYGGYQRAVAVSERSASVQEQTVAEPRHIPREELDEALRLHEKWMKGRRDSVVPAEFAEEHAKPLMKQRMEAAGYEPWEIKEEMDTYAAVKLQNAQNQVYREEGKPIPTHADSYRQPKPPRVGEVQREASAASKELEGARSKEAPARTVAEEH